MADDVRVVYFLVALMVISVRSQDAVTNLSEDKASRTSSSLRITWTTLTGDHNYRVQRTDSSNPSDSGTVWSNGGLQSYNSQSVGNLNSNIESLNANTKYYIRIITCNIGNNCDRATDGTTSRHFGPFKTRCSVMPPVPDFNLITGLQRTSPASNLKIQMNAYSSSSCEVSLKVHYKKEGDTEFLTLDQGIDSGQTKEISWTSPYRTPYIVSVTPYDDTFPIEDRKRTKTIVTAYREGAVQDLTVTNQTGTFGFVVSWKPPASPGSLQQYVLKSEELGIGDCKVNSQPLPTVSSSMASTDGSGILESVTTNSLGLPYRRYNITVNSANEYGIGKASYKEVFSTSSAPNVSISGITAGHITSKSIQVYWSQAPCIGRNGPTRGYHYYLLDGTTQLKEDYITGTAVDFTDLTPFKEYTFKLAFSSWVGDGPQETKAVKTTDSAPSAPLQVRATGGENTISVSWGTPNPPNGIITGYDISHRTSGTSDWTSIPLGVVNSYMITQLEINQEYDIRVCAYTKRDYGCGPWSVEIKASTVDGVPGPPKSLRSAAVSETSFTLLWDPPDQKGGTIIDYTVSCVPQSPHPPEAVTRTSTVITKQAAVSGLYAGVQYKCSVKARTSRGTGPEISEYFYTKLATPSIPADDLPKLEKSQLPYVLVLDNINLPKGPTYKYRVVVEIDTRKKRNAAMPESMMSTLTDYSSAMQRGSRHYIAAQLDSITPGQRFPIGDNKTYGTYYNAALEDKKSYKVWFGVQSTAGTETKSMYWMVGDLTVSELVARPTSDSPTGAIVGGVVGFVLLMVLILALVLYIRRSKAHAVSRDEEDKISMVAEDTRPPSQASRPNSETPSPAPATPRLPPDGSSQDEMIYMNADAIEKRHVLKSGDLWDFVKRGKENKYKIFKDEYKSIPKQPGNYSSDVGTKLENKDKNRFTDIFAYDRSRVILDVIDDDPHSDYMNANYVDSYKQQKAFIAAQGPNLTTLNDMWRMIWQENCNKIIMLTNTVENGRTKCEPYWPEEGSHEYGDITVTLMDEAVFCDFTIRTLRVAKQEEERMVKQFHYISWYDHRAADPTSFLEYLRKVKDFAVPSTGPMLAHCSAGVGRTGSYIAVDYLLDQLRETNEVDVYNCVLQMRTQRPNMVQTWLQYAFIHDVLRDYSLFGESVMKSDRFCMEYNVLSMPKPGSSKTKLEQQYEMLQKVTAALDRKKTVSAEHPENAAKNRSSTIIPGEMDRPYLMTPMDGGSNYINAVVLNSYSRRDAYIVTQMPLPNTVGDFWRLLYDYKSQTVVMMNNIEEEDESYAIYWPDEDTKEGEYGPLKVQLLSTNTEKYFIERQFRLSHSKRESEEPISIKQFQFTTWPSDEKLPKSKTAILELYRAVEKWQQKTKNGKITIHCMDGAARSGLFSVILNVLEKFSIEHEVDIARTVLQMREVRRQIIQGLDQYQFVHEMVVEFLDSFGDYANFT